MKNLSRYFFIVMLFMNAGVHAQLTYETLWVQYDSPWTYKNLQLIPVRYKSGGVDPLFSGAGGPRLITLQEALEKGKVKVREMQAKEGASVNSLEIVNTSKDYVLVSSGELLSGGKQDRMIGETKILSPGKEAAYIDVFCVEKGRWDRKPKPFKNKGRADHSLQKIMDLSGRQAEVWKEIQRQFIEEKKTSETWPYLALGKQNQVADSGYARYFINKYKASDSLFAGFIAITGNRIISCKLFASAEMTTISFGSMLNGFIEPAIHQGSRPVMKQATIKAFMDRLLENEKSQKEFVAGRGKLYRYDTKVIHLVVYGE